LKIAAEKKIWTQTINPQVSERSDGRMLWNNEVQDWKPEAKNRAVWLGLSLKQS
jgi:hypothetical protein